MPLVDVNGVRLSHLQMGCDDRSECEHVVMVHGLATSMAFWCFHHAPAFAGRYRVTTYDLRGHGRSGVTESGYTAKNMAADLRQLLDHFGIERAHFVAHSFGGLVTLNLALSEPHRIASLVLADTHISAGRLLGKTRGWKFGERLQPALDQHGLDLDTTDPYFGYRLLTEVARMRLQNIEIAPALRELVHPMLGKSANRTAMRWLRLMDTTAAEREMMDDDGLSLESLRKLRFPILAMYGEDSQAMATGELFLDVWPDAHFRRVRGAGHFFPSSRPSELVDACMQFWNEGIQNGIVRRFGEHTGSYFRSNRLIKRDGVWFVLTRGYHEAGPFARLEDADGFRYGLKGD